MDTNAATGPVLPAENRILLRGGEKSSNAGWVQVLSDKLSKAAAELVGLKEPQSSGQAGRQAAEKQER